MPIGLAIPEVPLPANICTLSPARETLGVRGESRQGRGKGLAVGPFQGVREPHLERCRA
jgi:hypothetical protein